MHKVATKMKFMILIRFFLILIVRHAIFTQQISICISFTLNHCRIFFITVHILDYAISRNRVKGYPTWLMKSWNVPHIWLSVLSYIQGTQSIYMQVATNEFIRKSKLIESYVQIGCLIERMLHNILNVFTEGIHFVFYLSFIFSYQSNIFLQVDHMVR